MHKFTNCVKTKLKKIKLIFLIRFNLVLVVLCLIYLTFLLQKVDKPNKNFVPSSYTRLKILSVDQLENCSKPGILAFPSDGFTKEQRQHGWIIVHIVLMFYGFWFLASIYDNYLVPSVKEICSDFNIDNDVIRATVMAAAVSSPQLFMNCIGTFIAKGDIGVGTIVGSSVFNILIVPGCCGIIAISYFKLDWWPITRDTLMYLLSILALWGISSDGQVWWYEALGLVIVYFLYLLIMYLNPKLCPQAKRILKSYYRPQYIEVTEFTTLLGTARNVQSKYKGSYTTDENLENNSNTSAPLLYSEHQERKEFNTCHTQNHKVFLFYWPIKWLLWLTMPNSHNHNYWQYLTFIISLVWVASMSYVVTFAVCVIGDTLNIPDAIMGLTFLAAGTGIPEAISSLILSSQGQGSMGMNNNLGRNTFDILMGLGLPWLIKALYLPELSSQRLLSLNTNSFTYAIIMLLSTLLAFYVLLIWNKFILNRHVAASCIILYIGFMITATLLELNVFFPINLPSCRT